MLCCGVRFGTIAIGAVAIHMATAATTIIISGTAAGLSHMHTGGIVVAHELNPLPESLVLLQSLLEASHEARFGCEADELFRVLTLLGQKF